MNQPNEETELTNLSISNVNKKYWKLFKQIAKTKGYSGSSLVNLLIIEYVRKYYESTKAQ